MFPSTMVIFFLFPFLAGAFSFKRECSISLLGYLLYIVTNMDLEQVFQGDFQQRRCAFVRSVPLSGRLSVGHQGPVVPGVILSTWGVKARAGFYQMPRGFIFVACLELKRNC